MPEQRKINRPESKKAGTEVQQRIQGQQAYAAKMAEINRDIDGMKPEQLPAVLARISKQLNYMQTMISSMQDSHLPTWAKVSIDYTGLIIKDRAGLCLMADFLTSYKALTESRIEAIKKRQAEQGGADKQQIKPTT